MEIGDKKTQLDILLKLDETQKKIEKLSYTVYSIESFMGVLLNVKRSVSILDEVIVNQVLDILRYLVLMIRGEENRAQNTNEAWRMLFSIQHFRFWGLKRSSAEKLFVSKDPSRHYPVADDVFRDKYEPVSKVEADKEISNQ